MSEELRTYALISKEGVNIADLNYYMEKDTSGENAIIREYYPDREIKATEKWNNNRMTFYDLTEDEVRQLKLNPDVYDVDYLIREWSLGDNEDYTTINTESNPYILEPLPIQESIFSANLNSDNFTYFADSYTTITSASLFSKKGAPINWGLKFHTVYTESVDWEELLLINPTSGTPLYSKTDYPYTLDGTGVDLVILDSGVKPHPEFLDDEGNLRLVEFDWYQYIPGVNMPSNFYTRYGASTPQHGTHVASIAAGRTNGWAKNAKIYSFKIFRTVAGPPAQGGAIEHALEAIRHFHVSKSIDPKTGFKRPTIVNASIGMSTEVVKTYPPSLLPNQPDYYITQITNIFYKGNSLGLSGSNNVPTLKHNIRHQYSSSVLDEPGYFTLVVPYSPNYIDVLMKQLTDAGVIFIKSAGNNQSIICKAYDANNPQYYKDIYNTYITSNKYISFQSPGTPIYTNRADFDSPDTIVVGSMSPFLTFKNSKITDPSDPGYNSYTYDIWNIKGSISYYLSDQFYHGDPLLWNNASGKLPGVLNYPFRRGMGSQSLFPGWEYARASASLSVSPYSNVGPAVDIFSAGHFIAGAWFQDPFYNSGSAYANVTASYINYKNYDPNYVPTHPSLSLDEYMYVISGTSMAAPQIAGIACLYFQLNPGATAKQFKLFLSASAIKTPQMQIFSEDPENKYDYTGSMFTSLLASKYYTKSQTIALNGSPTLVAHWPYSNPNKAEISSVKLTKI